MDLAIHQSNYNKWTLLNNKIPIELYLHFHGDQAIDDYQNSYVNLAYQ